MYVRYHELKKDDVVVLERYSSELRGYVTSEFKVVHIERINTEIIRIYAVNQINNRLIEFIGYNFEMIDAVER